MKIQSEESSGDLVIRAVVNQALPLLRWSVIVGDVVHNLRSCLDHLVWALGVDEQGDPGVPLPGPWKRLSFPIFKNRTDFIKANLSGDPIPSSGLGKIWALRADLQRAITLIQPFNSPDPVATPLWLLNELWNIDKHRHIVLCGFIIATDRFRTDPPFRLDLKRPIQTGPFEDGSEVARFGLLLDEPKEVGDEVLLSLTLVTDYDVAFSSSEPTLGGRVVPTLESLLSEVAAVTDMLSAMANQMTFQL